MAAEASPVTWTEFGILFSAAVLILLGVISALAAKVAKQNSDLTEHRVQTATKFQEYLSIEAFREFKDEIKTDLRIMREEMGRGIKDLASLFNNRHADGE